MSSGHHSHGRLGQPPNTSSWNHLQVPSYIPRQPQLAHLSTERPMTTWHTPTPDTLYNYMATNHKNPLEISPIMPTFPPPAPNSSPFGGTMDLTMTSTFNSSPQKKSPLPSQEVNHQDIPPKEKSNGEVAAGTLFVRDAKQINNDVAKSLANISAPAEPVELVKETPYNPMMKNHAAAKCNSPVQPPAFPMRQSPAPSVTPPQINQPSDLSSASTGKENSLQPLSPGNNQQQSAPATPMEDFVDTNGGRKRRKRKPNKTQRMENQPEEVEKNEHQSSLTLTPTTSHEISDEKKISESPVTPVSAIEESLVSEGSISTPGTKVEISPKRRSRRKGADDGGESVETVDLITNTESHQTPEKITPTVLNENSTKNCLEEDKSGEFDEVENKLEQMFAGIEDRSAPATCVTMQETPAGSKPATAAATSKGRKRTLSKDEDLPSQKKRRKGRKGATTAAAAAAAGKTTLDKGSVGKKKKEAGPASESSSTPKFRGPFIQLRTGGVTCVINTPQTEEESQVGRKNFHSHANIEQRKIRGLHLSTLSTKYDADTTDATWMCIFCKYGPHKMGLGDLFGPYSISTQCEEFQLSQLEPNVDDFKSKRTKSMMVQRKPHCLPVVAATSSVPSSSTSGGKKKKKTSAGESAGEVHLDIFAGMGRVNEETLEVWLHEDCIVWAPGVHLVGFRLVGLEAAVWGSTRHLCTLCTKNGASIGCLERGCREMIHVPCARQSNWRLSDEDFKSHCAKHSPPSSSVCSRVNGDN